MGWEPYKPPWCTLTDRNVWEDDPSTMQAGRRPRYAVWADQFSPAELQAMIRECRERGECAT